MNYDGNRDDYDFHPALVQVRRLSDADDLPNIVTYWQLGQYEISKPWKHGPEGWTIADVVWAPGEEPDHGAQHWIVIGALDGRFGFRHYSGLKTTWSNSFADALEQASDRLRDEVARGLRT